jgi:hypothetical protein
LETLKMSYDVKLEDASGIVQVEPHEEGGTYALGGSSRAVLNVTYNYSAHFHAAFDGMSLRDAIHGKRASDVLSLLERGVHSLGTERDDDYWSATEGNAGHVLNLLLGWARQHPDATFNVG